MGIFGLSKYAELDNTINPCRAGILAEARKPRFGHKYLVGTFRGVIIAYHIIWSMLSNAINVVDYFKNLYRHYYNCKVANLLVLINKYECFTYLPIYITAYDFYIGDTGICFFIY